MEKIVSIEEVYDKNVGNLFGLEGFSIKTSKQEVLLLVTGGKVCCEDIGYLMSEDDVSDYIGSELLDIELTDVGLDVRSIQEEIKEDHQIESGGIVFVNIKTSSGLLQFVVYNYHNGNYGHRVMIRSNQLEYEEYL